MRHLLLLQGCSQQQPWLSLRRPPHMMWQQSRRRLLLLCQVRLVLGR